MMNLKLRLSLADLVKVLLGGTCLVMCPYNQSIYRVQRGKETYITKG